MIQSEKDIVTFNESIYSLEYEKYFYIHEGIDSIIHTINIGNSFTHLNFVFFDEEEFKDIPITVRKDENNKNDYWINVWLNPRTRLPDYRVVNYKDLPHGCGFDLETKDGTIYKAKLVVRDRLMILSIYS